LAEAASRHGASPAQLALAWLLHRSPVMLPIPGTSKVSHLEDNMQAAALELSADEVRLLEEVR
jgi:aryl-alcohol dehydrogenase-like predicted oxidoreductase